MPTQIPLVPGDPNYRLETTIDGVPYIMDMRWNSRDAAHYMDLYTEDETPIVLGLKLVLGVYLGRYINHTLFRNGAFVMVDTSGQRRDATLDDIGARVQLIRYTIPEIFGSEPDLAIPDGAL